MNNQKGKEYIYFEFKKDQSEVYIEIDDSSLLVDFRAYCKAILFFSEGYKGMIYWNCFWITSEEFLDENDRFMNMKFEHSIVESLN